ncbi:MAG TPA: hypothetical protein VN520_02990 [Streptomyces sp.]|uniref:hypothetical protein n=1 Tax=Streptomyces sp. TaxID=1931 RepID=UPI002CDA943C|nr:hypothetical protein [Streptomyces sp.]HWU05363.1 hypothetical protein [Streptomyces sp.]
MIDAEALNDLLKWACLIFDARATHTGGAAGSFTTMHINQLADDLLAALDSCEVAERPYLMEGYRSLSLAADIPPGRSCQQREMLVDVARQGLAYVVIGRQEERPATKDEVLALLQHRWTASMLAWADFFPPSLDEVSPSCSCGTVSLGSLGYGRCGSNLRSDESESRVSGIPARRCA